MISFLIFILDTDLSLFFNNLWDSTTILKLLQLLQLENLNQLSSLLRLKSKKSPTKLAITFQRSPFSTHSHYYKPLKEPFSLQTLSLDILLQPSKKIFMVETTLPINLWLINGLTLLLANSNQLSEELLSIKMDKKLILEN